MMKKQETRNKEQKIVASQRGFTLLETLVAITLLTTSIVAPMSLTARSLSSAYYARDQVTAFHLSQEAIEAVRTKRDGNILQNALGEQTDILAGIPLDTPFIVDARLAVTDPEYFNENACIQDNGCPPLEVNTSTGLYGYGDGLSGWTETRFTRTVIAEVVRAEEGVPQEIRISATVTWQSGAFNERTFTISENMYRWLGDSTTI